MKRSIATSATPKPLDRRSFLRRLVGEGRVHPVMLFAFHDEIVSEVLCIWLVMARLRYNID